MSELDGKLFRKIKSRLDSRKSFEDFMNSYPGLNVHFYPIYLSDICVICYNKTSDEYCHESFSDATIIEITVDRILRLITDNHIGYNIFHPEEHDRMHSAEDESLINYHHINGDVRWFIREYEQYVPADILEKVEGVLK